MVSVCKNYGVKGWNIKFWLIQLKISTPVVNFYLQTTKIIGWVVTLYLAFALLDLFRFKRGEVSLYSQFEKWFIILDLLHFLQLVWNHIYKMFLIKIAKIMKLRDFDAVVIKCYRFLNENAHFKYATFTSESILSFKNLTS